MQRLPRRLAAIGAAVTLAAVLAPSASAHDSTFAVGFVTQSVDADERTVTGSLHCVDGLENKVVTLRFDSGLEAEQFVPGAPAGLAVRRDDKRVVEVLDAPPCDIGAADDGTVAAEPKPVSDDDDDRVRGDGGFGKEKVVKGSDETEDETDEPRKVYPSFARGFLNRVWRIGGQADGYEAGVLSMTIGKVFSLPRRWRKFGRGLVDSDARVLVAPSVKVFDGRKAVPERREAEILADADRVRVQGKLLPAAKWLEDEDGEPVPTIRAKRVYVTR